MQLKKAVLQPLSGEPGKPVEFMFNPNQLAFARTVKWQAEQGNRSNGSQPNSSLPKVNFSGVDPYKLTLNQIIFDTYETQESVIEKYIKDLKKGAESPDGRNKRPPVYRLEWGRNKTFPCVITSLSYKLDMFLTNGTPVRAIVDISLQEVEKENLPGDRQPSGRTPKESRSARQNAHRPQQPPPRQTSSNTELSDF
ncbi:hypothetical protein H6F89_28235 [Cyanobacteria bacterium FACHB-63]|nr:hypothetical protein [Cyanobacteria bacterium FACHB-63]